MRVKASQKNDLWIFGRNIIFVLTFMLFVFEWQYSRGITVNWMPVYLSYPGYMGGPLLVLLAFVTGMARYMAPVRQPILRLLFLYAGTLASIFVHQFILYEYSTETSKFELIQLFMMPIFAIFGLILGSNIENVRRFLKWFAYGCVGACLISAILTVLLGANSIGLICRASWPMRLVLMFGFCWFFSHWLVGRTFWNWNFLAMIACMSEVVFTLHKPVIFATIFAVTTIALLSRRAAISSRGGINPTRKLVFLGLIAAVGFALIDVITGGKLTDAVSEFWHVKVMHEQRSERVVRNSDDALEMAAGGRLEIWSEAIKGFTYSPFVGSGYQQIDIGEQSINLHNGYLDWLLAFGLISSLPILCIWIGWFRKIILRWNALPPAIKVIIVPIVGYIVAMAAFNLGGTARLFANVTYFIALVSGMAFRMVMIPATPLQAVNVPKKHPQFSGM